MTTQNTNVNTATTLNAANTEATTQGSTEAVKAVRLTLISALEAGNAVDVATVLLKQGRDLETITEFAKTFNAAKAEFKTALKLQAEEAARLEKEKEANRQQQENLNKAAEEAKKKAAQLAMSGFVDALIANGFSKEDAEKMAEGAQFTTAGGKRSTVAAPKETVKVNYKGTEMLVKVTGNNPNAVKDAIKEAGFGPTEGDAEKTAADRKAFIEKYKIA